METRIQFRIDPDTKELAQKTAQRKGITLSDACREFTERLASEQKKFESHEDWLDVQVDEAFAALDRGALKFFSEDEAKARILQRREEILKKYAK
jgi:antitoxin component of RelBE/YafQ-DinJ toxin-antitoxin module